MHNHFDKNLNLRDWILKRRPRRIVECGAGNGELALQVEKLHEFYDFEYHIISDYRPDNVIGQGFHLGLSYNALKEFADQSIDLCIIDTDHNYWTLMKELAVVSQKMTEGGLIALHDVETFYHDTGMAMSYSDDTPYPKDVILEYAKYGGLGDAMIEFLQSQEMRFKLLCFTPESHGAALIEKKTQSQYTISVPGSAPIYSKQPKQEEEYAGV